MKKIYNSLIMPLSIAIALTSHAQNGTLPPVNFNGSTYLCDDASYKLVFFDDFNGTNIDHTKWNTYTSWDGMKRGIAPGDTIYGDHQYWKGARTCNINALFKDENVVVNGGTCKLLLRNESYTWNCPTCIDGDTVISKYLTAGEIVTPFHFTPNGTNNFYNSGKFEAKIKFPIIKGAWCAFWTWNGTGINEIDIAEAWGGNVPWFPLGLINNQRDNTYNLHAWAPKPGSLNIYNLPNPASLNNRYPNQNWWSWITGSYHHQEDWHIYTCEWDTSSIKTYLDGVLINTIWKYYKNQLLAYYNGNNWITYYVKVPSGCTPSSGAWHVTEGFPYNDSSQSHLRLSTGFTKDQTGTSGSNYTLGQMEIDYVKIWQRHPEQDGHSDICSYNGTLPVISGPAVAGSSYTFTVTNPVPGGYWTSSSGFVISSSNSSSATLQYTGQSGYLSHAVSYVYSPAIPGCPVKNVTKYFYTDLQLPEPFQPVSILEAQIDNTDMHQFVLARTDASPDMGLHNGEAQYSWDIYFSLGADTPRNLVHYSTEGKFASTPFLDFQGRKKYYLKWVLTVATPYDTASWSGVRNSRSEMYRQKNDSALWHFSALITDTAKYESAVYNRVLNNMVGEDADSIDILSMINQVRMEELEPYLIIDTAQMQSMRGIAGSMEPVSTKIYPNPTGNLLNIEPGEPVWERSSGKY